jgi:16S rRNA (adenine1518-N6/adenine1519-N6)-dimethyltransferase
LGQHFLVDEDALESIVDAAGIEPEDHVIEIGPGIGILTRELLRHAGSVTAIEIDARLIPLMRTFIPEEDQRGLETVNQNALHASLPSEPYKIVANIPYHITSPLLRHVFLESQPPPKSVTLLIQKEVAQTICDAKSAGILTILVRLFGTPRYICGVPSASFLPPPKVDSAVLSIACFEKPRAERLTIDTIFKLTKIAFAGKRKMLRNTLGHLPDGMEKLAKAAIDPQRRPQTLSIDEWILLANLFA